MYDVRHLLNPANSADEIYRQPGSRKRKLAHAAIDLQRFKAADAAAEARVWVITME